MDVGEASSECKTEYDCGTWQCTLLYCSVE